MSETGEIALYDVDFEDVRMVIRIAGQRGIDTPGFAMAALRRIEDRLEAAQTDAAALRAERDRYREALESIAKGVWIARADACLETIEWMARQGLEQAKRAAVEQAKAALASDTQEAPDAMD